MTFRKFRLCRTPRFKFYRCVVTYLDYEHDGEPSLCRTLHYAVEVRYFERFVQLLEDTFDFFTISRLSILYSPVNRDFYSLI